MCDVAQTRENRAFILICCRFLLKVCLCKSPRALVASRPFICSLPGSSQRSIKGSDCLIESVQLYENSSLQPGQWSNTQLHASLVDVSPPISHSSRARGDPH